MKTIQKRIYAAALPQRTARLRANSASTSRSLYNPSSSPNSTLSFFESAPPLPPPSRPANPHVLSTTPGRIPVQVENGPQGQANPNAQHNNGSSPPFSLALTSPQPTHTSSSPQSPYQTTSLFPYSSFATSPFYTPPSDTHRSLKRQRVRYQLDVGAYGIPKSCRRQGAAAGIDTPLTNGRFLFQQLPQSRSSEDLNLAVQVGEDAYFIRGNNAMGVADGVGGWSKGKLKNGDKSPTRSSFTTSTPSALFARRLMHYCSSEVDALCSTPPPLYPPPPPNTHTPAQLSNRSTLASRSPPLSPISTHSLHDDLQNSLSDLEDGLNVLTILERAYEKTIKAHVIPPSPPSSGETTPTPSTPKTSTIPIPTSPRSTSPLTISSSSFSLNNTRPSSPTPLLTGSSTALLAVLDHVPHPTGTKSPPTSNSNANTPAPAHTDADAVIKIAHIGDCMGMLIRGEEIVWRSEEMWWSFNTPVQLGPQSTALPSDAHVYTLPVQVDDVLILASDGLSDNLWDEEVVDEVGRLRREWGRWGSGFEGPFGGGGGEETLVGIGEEREGWAGMLRRRTLAGMLSEALCSRARRVSERSSSAMGMRDGEVMNEVPFARRARENQRPFRGGGKNDDISVIVAVISPAAESGKPTL